MAETLPESVSEAEAIEAVRLGFLAMSEAMVALDAAGLDIVDALKRITDENGDSFYSQLPAQIRMLLG